MTAETRTDAAKQAAHAADPILLSVRLAGVPKGSGLEAEWLKVIWAINKERKGYIGEPVATYQWWAKGWCEEYPEFRVILRDDTSANVQAKTPEAVEFLRAAVLQVTGRPA